MDLPLVVLLCRDLQCDYSIFQITLTTVFAETLSIGGENWCSLCVANNQFICVLSSDPRGGGVG